MEPNVEKMSHAKLSLDHSRRGGKVDLTVIEELCWANRQVSKSSTTWANFLEVTLQRATLAKGCRR